jgi:hypothetical protein
LCIANLRQCCHDASNEQKFRDGTVQKNRF